MLNLVIGTDWISNRDAIFEMISQDVQHQLEGRVMLVPELISHDTERRLCEAAGDSCSRYAEVLSFTRLVNRVADTCGHPVQPCLDDGGRLAAMAAAVQQIRSRLKAYASVGTRPEFLSDLVDAIDEFKRCCISSADLSNVARQLDGSLAQKVEELSLLLEAYDSICNTGKRDPRDEMTWLLHELEICDYAQTHTFYIDGFPDFTRQHMAILEHLIQYSPSVTVSLTCDAPGTKMLAFEKAGQTARELISLAQRAGQEVNVQNALPRQTSTALIASKLFQGAIEENRDLPLAVSRYESLYQECSAAAERVMNLVQNGYRYRDIGIVCADMPQYCNLLNLVFEKCRIPTYVSGTDDVLENYVIGSVLAALDAVLNGFEQADVLRYLKSPLSPLTQATVDRIENYVIMWSITGNKWLNEWQQHPDGLDGKWNERSEQFLAELNEARLCIIKPLMFLKNGFQSATTVAEQVKAVYGFLEQISLEKKLKKFAEAFEGAADFRNAQIANQLWDILINALEQMHDMLGHIAWNQDVFTKLFRIILSQYKVGTIPPVLDAVYIGPVSAMRCQQVSHLIVLGAVEGALPGYSGSAGILSDQERVTLRALGVPLTGGSIDGLQAEFAEIYGVFCGATESVSVSCPCGQPSFLYRRLKLLAGEEHTDRCIHGAVLSDPGTAAARIARNEDVIAAHRLGLSEMYEVALEGKNHTFASVSREQIDELYGKRLHLSASQVDKQADCRLHYFLRYGIRASERKPITVDPAEFGTYVHAVLEETAREVNSLGGFKELSLQEVLAIAAKHSTGYAQERFGLLDTQRLRYLFQRNDRELMMIVEELWKEMQVSRFVPSEFELSFGEGGRLPAIEINGSQMEADLRGFVDRVDVWHHDGANFFRVVDYKTGKKDFDYCDVFNGYGLQMLLYLFALEEKGANVLGDECIPAGVQYFPARVPYVSADKSLSNEEAESERNKLWKRKGLLLSDEDVLNAMEPEETWYRLPCAKKKDGTLTGDVADAQQLKLLKKYVFAFLGKLVDEIASGNVDPNPYTRGSNHDACAFCPYGSVCHSAQITGRRNYKTMSKERFWQDIEKEMKNRG